VTDLPWAGLPVKLVLVVRRFRCGSIACSRRIFAERFPSFVEPYGRLSTRLQSVLKHVALNMGGEPGKRLLKVLGIFVSGDKLLSLAYDAKLPASVSHRIIGVDDFALKRGQTYGTVIVDLETRKPVDLLPDRSAQTLTSWLKTRTGIEIISRDRSTEFERGISLGAPDATQVLDRWHVLKNLREACERQLKRYQSAMDEVAGEMKAEPYRLLRSPREEADRAVAQEKRRQRIQQIRDLHAQGLSKSAIARQLQVSLTFVRRSISLDALPERRYRKRQASMLDPFEDHLQRRWDEGCRNAKQLWREVCALGYPGGYKRVHQWRQRQRLMDQAQVASNSAGLPGRLKQGFAPQQLVWLLLLEVERLSEAETYVLEELCKRESALGELRRLAQNFLCLFRKEHADGLDNWFQAVAKSDLKDLQTFAWSLQRDQDALAAAIKLPWSNGPTEGVVTKIKLVKRQMYGRGSFELLRRRVLLAA